ncbi:MAG: hypothetical protein P4N59_12265 [Negativicutes bacterium]|nr:hypothetical protein [Negativicutes bacterium]
MNKLTWLIEKIPIRLSLLVIIIVWTIVSSFSATEFKITMLQTFGRDDSLLRIVEENADTDATLAIRIARSIAVTGHPSSVARLFMILSNPDKSIYQDVVLKEACNFPPLNGLYVPFDTTDRALRFELAKIGVESAEPYQAYKHLLNQQAFPAQIPYIEKVLIFADLYAKDQSDAEKQKVKVLTDKLKRYEDERIAIPKLEADMKQIPELKKKYWSNLEFAASAGLDYLRYKNIGMTYEANKAYNGSIRAQESAEETQRKIDSIEFSAIQYPSRRDNFIRLSQEIQTLLRDL